MKNSKEKKFQEDFETFFEMMKTLEENDIKITDWDDKHIEVQFPDGTKKRETIYWMTLHIQDKIS